MTFVPRLLPLLLGCLLGGLVSLNGSALAAAASATATPAAADTSGTLPSGATFTIPKAWSARIEGPVALLSAPEADAHIAIVDVGAAADAKAAAAKAWALYHPGAEHVPGLVSAAPPKDGWEERQSLAYDTPPNAHAVMAAMAFRKSGAWTVLIVDGNQGTFEKRSAATGLISQSLRPAGYSRESFVGRKANTLDAGRIEALKAFVQTSMQQLGVPGASIALTDHGRVVFEGGFGVRELGKPAPVDAHTTFMIASNTKGMTTLLLAKLVDEGKLSWDEPVTKAYPAFRLGSEATTRKVLMRHLVCACTGLPRKDLEWALNANPKTPATNTFVLLAATEPTSGFGEVFQYNNLMASAAGYVGAHVLYPGRELGAAYDAAMQEKVFGPLAMTETSFDYARMLAGNHASPHGMDLNGKPATESMAFNYAGIPSRPAGGAWSSAHDMIKYVENELSLGKLPGGQQMVSSKNLLVRREPGVPIGEDGFYGMGLSGDKVGGVLAIHHGGSMKGFKSDLMLIPDAGIGAVILTNADEGGALLRPFLRRLFEVVYDGKPEAAADVAAAGERMRAGTAKLKAELAVPPTADLAASLASAYRSPELGSVTVRKDARGVYFNFGAWGSYVGSKKNQDGTISFVASDPGAFGIDFVRAERSGKRALVVRDGQHEYVYTEGK